ncbi:MAG TPA: phytanoyl-CoA dioxygenase family protein [Stenomitos sp.]
MHLSEIQESLLPTEEDIVFYETHGWYISPKVIPDEVFDIAMRGVERLYRDDRDVRLPVATGYHDWKPQDGDGLRNNEFISLQIKELQQLALYPMIGAIAARLARTTEIRLLDDQVVYKPAHSGDEVGWHADGAYWSTCTSPHLLTAWIPFHDVDEQDGTLLMLDESHRWDPEILQDTRLFNNTVLEEVEAQFRQLGCATKRVPIAMKKGQVSFHNCWTMHGSPANVSDRPRIAMAVHLQDKDNHYRPFRNRDGQDIRMFDEVLCRKLPNGDPDFSDPQVFPVLWSAEEARLNPSESVCV